MQVALQGFIKCRVGATAPCRQKSSVGAAGSAKKGLFWCYRVLHTDVSLRHPDPLLSRDLCAPRPVVPALHTLWLSPLPTPLWCQHYFGAEQESWLGDRHSSTPAGTLATARLDLDLDSIGLDSIDLDSIGLDSIGLDLIGLESTDTEWLPCRTHLLQIPREDYSWRHLSGDTPVQISARAYTCTLVYSHVFEESIHLSTAARRRRLGRMGPWCPRAHTMRRWTPLPRQPDIWHAPTHARTRARMHARSCARTHARTGDHRSASRAKKCD